MNPLLSESMLPYGAPEFDKIRKEHYIPAFEEGIRQAKAEVDAIVSNPEIPDFHNTIEALEYSGRTLDRVSGIFYNLLEADADDEMQEIAERVSPAMTGYSTYVSLNEALFSKIRYVYEHLGSMSLDQEQKRLAEQTYRNFKRRGSELEGKNKAQFSGYLEELSLKSLKFGKNVLEATNAYILHITDPCDLSGIPESSVNLAAEEARNRNIDGWVFTLQRPSYSAFMRYCDNPELRRRMYIANCSKGLSGDSDNRDVVRRIAELRLETANLLGYRCWADYVLEDTMAGSTETVRDFLSELMKPSLPVAKKEVSMLQEYADAHGFRRLAEQYGLPSDGLMPWDFSYWAEKCKSEMYSVDDQKLKPYFRLESCIDAVFGLAGKMYGIAFEERRDLPVYHDDVKVYDVKDRDGTHLALLYADFFPRATKRAGAWMTEFSGQRIENGVESRPVVSIVMNFTKPSCSEPSLLTHDELVTLLHEFGHSLHGMLAKGKYPSLTGTNVSRDFVELPSQLMENWAFEPEFLSTFAVHYQTGEPLSADQIGQIVRAKNYLSGYYQVRQLNFGIVDMAWHSLEKMTDKDVEDFENDSLGESQILPVVSGTAISTSFSHIFSGGYSAGYYSYKWAEVLEADAFEYFKQKGLAGGEASDSFRKNILERGDSEDSAILYRRFRGHDPKPEALLRKLGLCI